MSSDSYTLGGVEQTGKLADLPLPVLADACRVQLERFAAGQPSQEDFAMELFRRAICRADQAAWAVLFEMYRGLLVGQLRRCPAQHVVLAEPPEYWLNEAFERFWQAVRPERYQQFPDVGSLLRYLKLCLHSVVLDHARAQARRACLSLEAAAHEPTSGIAIDDRVAGKLAANELWQAITRELRDEQELLVAWLSFVRGLQPRSIFERCPEKFADVEQVYRVKRNLLERLRRRGHVAVASRPIVACRPTRVNDAASVVSSTMGALATAVAPADHSKNKPPRRL